MSCLTSRGRTRPTCARAFSAAAFVCTAALPPSSRTCRPGLRPAARRRRRPRPRHRPRAASTRWSSRARARRCASTRASPTSGASTARDRARGRPHAGRAAGAAARHAVHVQRRRGQERFGLPARPGSRATRCCSSTACASVRRRWARRRGRTCRWTRSSASRSCAARCRRPLRHRRHRRRGPGLHAPRRRGAALRRHAAAGSHRHGDGAGLALRRGRVRRHRAGRSAPGRAATRRPMRAAQFGSFNPDATASGRTAQPCIWAGASAAAGASSLGAAAPRRRRRSTTARAPTPRRAAQRGASGARRRPGDAAWRTAVRVGASTDDYDTLGSARIHAARRHRAPCAAVRLGEHLRDAAGQRCSRCRARAGAVEPAAGAYDVTERDIDGVAAGLGGAPAAIRGRPACATTATRSSARRPPARWPTATRSRRPGASAPPGHQLRRAELQPALLPRLRQPELQPEEGRHGEVSLRWAAAGHSVRAAYFEHRYRGFITSGPRAGQHAARRRSTAVA